MNHHQQRCNAIPNRLFCGLWIRSLRIRYRNGGDVNTFASFLRKRINFHENRATQWRSLSKSTNADTNRNIKKRFLSASSKWTFDALVFSFNGRRSLLQLKVLMIDGRIEFLVGLQHSGTFLAPQHHHIHQFNCP